MRRFEHWFFIRAWPWSGLAAAAIGGALASMLLASAVKAHGDAQWITDQDWRDRDNISCCGPDDCAEVPDTDVRLEGTNYIVKSPYTDRIYSIPAHELKPSIDGDWWLCVYHETQSTHEGIYVPEEWRCFFGPLVGS